MKRALSRRAADAVKERGRATLDDIQPEFPGYTRKQVHAALENARSARLIRLICRGRRHGSLSVWEAGAHEPAPPQVTPRHPIPSVWALGTPLQWEGEWPPLLPGREFRPLGDWNAEEVQLG